MCLFYYWTSQWCRNNLRITDREALRIRTECFGDDRIEVGDTWHCLANVYSMQGENEDALMAFQEGNFMTLCILFKNRILHLSN